MHVEGYGPQDVEMVDRDYEYDEPVCVCEQYVGTQQVAFCQACRMYTDSKELLHAFEAEVDLVIAAFGGKARRELDTCFLQESHLHEVQVGSDWNYQPRYEYAPEFVINNPVTVWMENN